MTLIDFVFAKLRTPKTWLDKCLQSPVLEHPWRRNMVNGPKHFWNLYQIYRSLSRQLSWKKSLLLTCQILGLLVKTLDANDRYPVLNRYYLTIPVEMQLCQKQKTFTGVFSFILNFSLNFEHFGRKDDPNRICISGRTDSENVFR